MQDLQVTIEVRFITLSDSFFERIGVDFDFNIVKNDIGAWYHLDKAQMGIIATAGFWTYGLALAGPAFGFGAEVSLAMIRLIMSGAMDAFPKLKVVIGHYGEGLPFLLDRLDFAANFSHVTSDSGAFVPLKRKPSEYLRENTWVSTSCNYLPAAFNCSREAMGMDHVVFGSDHPYGKMSECLAFLGERGLSAADQELLFEKNAAQLGVSG